MAKDEGRDVPPHWGPLKVEASDLSLRWGTWPLAAEGLSHPAPLPLCCWQRPMAGEVKHAGLGAGDAAGCGCRVDGMGTHGPRQGGR